MKISRVLLVSAPLEAEDDRKEAVNSHCFPPLGLLRIATALHREFPDIEIQVVDGDMVGLPAVNSFVQSFRPDLVGVGVLTPGYKSALKIASHSRASGVPYVVFGNDHASFFPELILHRHPDVSYIIVGDNGDRDFADLLRAIQNDVTPFEGVSSLYGISQGELRSSSHTKRVREEKQWQEDGANPQFIGAAQLAKYENAYSLRFGKYHDAKRVKPFIVNNAKGCYKGDDRCFYCSIYDLQMKAGNAAGFWSTIQGYWRDYGFNFFFEVCDNFSGMKAYRRSLVENIPEWFNDSDIELMVYADANRICHDPTLLEDFQRLHVRRVNLGLDSGDSGMLQILKGFQDAELNRRAMSLLSSRGIQVHCSFVLGGPGESEESLANTAALIDDALAEPAVVAVEVSPLFPLPRAPVWDPFLGEVDKPASRSVFEGLLPVLGRLRSDFDTIWKETRAHFQHNDVIELTLASEMWANHFTLVGHPALQGLVSDLNSRIAEAGKVTGGFG